MGKSPRIFIGYAAKDQQAARMIFADLKQAGADAWLDEECVLPGQSRFHAMKAALEGADCFLALVSAKSVNKKGAAQAELKETLTILDEYPQGAIRVIPVRLDESFCSHPRIKGIQPVDMFPSWDQGVDKIVRTLGVTAGEMEQAQTGKSDAASPPQPLPALTYVVISSVTLIIGIGFLYLAIAQGFFQQAYFLILILWALGTAAFLFGAMRSVASLTHKDVDNRVVRLGGPAAVFFILLAVGGRMAPGETFTLKIRPLTEDDQRIETKGTIELDLGGELRPGYLTERGDINFENIPSQFRGKKVKVFPKYSGYDSHQQTIEIIPPVVEVRLRKVTPPPPPPAFPGWEEDFIIDQLPAVWNATQWDYPRDQWGVERGEGDSPSDYALLVRGSGVGLRKVESSDFRLQFRARLVSGKKIAWLIRAQPDKIGGYVFELEQRGPILDEKGRTHCNYYLNGYLRRSNAHMQPLGEPKHVPLLDCCSSKQDAFEFCIQVRGSRFHHTLRHFSKEVLCEATVGDAVTLGFEDGAGTFDRGAVGFLQTDPGGVTKIEHVYVSALSGNTPCAAE